MAKANIVTTIATTIVITIVITTGTIIQVLHTTEVQADGKKIFFQEPLEK